MELEFVKFACVVDDLGNTMQALGKLVGYGWSEVFDFTNYLRYPDGREEDVQFNFVYSVQPPSIEFIQTVPGSSTWANGESHVGYSSPDFTRTCQEFEEAGLSMEVCGRGESDRPERFAYFKTPEGLRIEVVDRLIMPKNWDDFLHGRMEASGGAFR